MKKPKLNIDWKRVSQISLRVLVLVGFLASVGFTEHRRSEMLCKEVSITIDDSLGNSFVEREDIEQIIRDKFGKLEGKQVLSINTAMLESIINNNPFVLRAEVFSTINGKVMVKVKQRNPVVRIVNASNESYYIDEDGVLMPVSDKFSAHVLVANGNIFNRETEHKIRKMGWQAKNEETLQPTLLEKIFMVSTYIEKDDFWNAQIEQLYVNAEGEIELIPRVGNQTIVLGDETAIEEKFSRLFMLYKEGFSKTGWNQYSKIDLRFKDQVVCQKNK